MKNFLIIAFLLLPFQILFAQDLNMAKVAKDWDKIKKNFANEIKNDPELKAVYDTCGSFKWKIDKQPILFKLEKDDYKSFNLKGKLVTKYEEIRKTYLEKLAKDPKYAIPNGDTKDSLLKAYEKQIDSLTEANKKLSQDTAKLSKKLNQPISQKSFIEKVIDNCIIYLIALLELVVIILLTKKWSDKDNENEELSDQINTLKIQKQSSDSQLQKLKKQKPTEIIKETIKTVYVEKPITEEQNTSTVYKYLCQINSADGGFFKRVQDNYDGSSSYYRMFNIKDGEADFEFYGDAERAIKKWSSVLNSVAEYDGDTDTATRIETLQSGKVKYDSANERWNVIKKAQLKLY